VERALSKEELEKFPSITQLSTLARMSTSKLKNKFKEVYGMKLYEFYNRNRLQKAKEWIEAGDTSVKEAAYKVGFSSLSNFSKAFKKEFGLLPKELKQ
jgi:AraC-like DNA-binding protein